jgi:hypothetical protein
MKKTLVAAILGLVASASVMAQGRINLFNYNYAQGGGAHQIFNVGGTAPIEPGLGFNVGVYYQLSANQTFTDPTGFADPSSAGWILGTGANSTAPFLSTGYYQAAGDWTIGPNGYVSGQISVLIVAYNGADYASSLIRGHSAAFNMTPATGTDGAPETFNGQAPFQVYNVAVIPEPSTFALAGLGLASLLIFRRRK